MPQELHYTSLPRGLAPGSQGFCTVGATANMAPPLQARLEKLSAYRELFPPHDRRSGANPVNMSHVRMTAGQQTYTVLSRVGFAGADYSGRTNKYAHHLALAPDERAAGGPAWLMLQPGVLDTAWTGDARLVRARRLPQQDAPPRVCDTWKKIAGDAGWAGVLAKYWFENPRQASRLLYDVSQAPLMLSLLAEALALLPPERRWDVTFSTYAAQLPRDVQCDCCGYPVGQDAPSAPADALTLDLSRPLAAAPKGEWSAAAREGRSPNLRPIRTAPAEPGTDRFAPVDAPPAFPAQREVRVYTPRQRREPGRKQFTLPVWAIAALAAFTLLGWILWFITQYKLVRLQAGIDPQSVAAQLPGIPDDAPPGVPDTLMDATGREGNPSQTHAAGQFDKTKEPLLHPKPASADGKEKQAQDSPGIWRRILNFFS